MSRFPLRIRVSEKLSPAEIENLPEIFFFGTHARLISMSMEFTLLPINRSGWFEEDIIQHMNWKWASLYKPDYILTDGTGYGELNYLTSHIVAVKDVEMKIWVQTQSDSHVNVKSESHFYRCDHIQL